MLTESIIKQKIIAIGVNPNKLSDDQRIRIYKDSLHSLSDFLLTFDARRLTRPSLNILISDLTEIIRGVDSGRGKPISKYFRSIDAVVASLRDARNELYVASDMEDTKRKVAYYRCIDKSRDMTVQALKYFV